MNRSLLLLLSLSFGLASQAQESKCGSTLQDYYSKYQDQPEVLKALKLKDEAFSKLVEAKNNVSSSSSLLKMDAEPADKVVRYIPVVFHVLHEDNAHNISVDQIEDQLETLNEDFRRLNANASTTPTPFKYTQDSTAISFGVTDLNNLVGEGKYLVLQSGTGNASPEDFEFNIPSGDKVVIHFTNDDYANQPTVTPTNGETITYKAIDVTTVADAEALMNSVKTILDNDFASDFTTSIDTNGTSPTLVVDNKKLGHAVSSTEGIASLNLSLFERMPGRYVASDARIEFVLAKLDPEGNPTTGINRVYSDRSNMDNPGANPLIGAVTYNTWRNEMKSVIQWEPTKYFNIWSVQNIASEAGGSILGFAQFPTELELAPQTDGVVLRSDKLGSGGVSNVLGKTLTHEAGHWMQLLHIWGDDDVRPDGSQIMDPVPADDIATVSAGSDDVFDTPPAGNRTPNNCPTFKEDGEVNSLHGDMFMNYMDYGNDPCMSLFTFGQVQRMRASLDEFRPVIWSSENAMSTGISPDFDAATLKPAVDFSYSKRSIKVNATIKFTSLSINTTTSSEYNWTFTSGSTVINETGASNNVKFLVPGAYTVALEVTNANGSTTKTVKELIYVSPDATELTAPLYMNFTHYAEVHGPNNGVTPLTMGDDQGWHWTNIGSPNDGAEGGMRVNSNGKNEADVQTFYFKPLNTQGISNGAKFTFDYAYVKMQPDTDDRIRVMYRNSPTTQNWRELVTMSTNPAWNNSTPSERMSINDGGLQFTDYYPAAEDWKMAVSNTLSSSFVKKDWIEIRVEYFGRKGNYFYFDNVNISNAPLSTVENEFENTFSVYPNPNQGNATVEFNLEGNSDVQVEVVDILGKVYGTQTNGFSTGVNKIQVSELAGNLSNGIYFVKVTNNNRVYTQKFVVTK